MSFLGAIFLIIVVAFIGLQTYGIIVDIKNRRNNKKSEKKEDEGK